MIPFRLTDDLALVLTPDRKLMALCEFIHKSVTVGGIAEFELADHQVVQKQEAVTCRYYVGCWRFFGRLRSSVQIQTFCQVFRSDSILMPVGPKAADGENPTTVPYRYSLSAARSGKCNTYKPNPLTEDATLRPFNVLIFLTSRHIL